MKKQKTSIKNERGSTLLFVLGIAILVTSAFAFIMTYSYSSEMQLYQMRTRNQLNLFQAQWHTLIGQPSSYVRCKFDTPNSCQFDKLVLKRYQSRALIGAGCTRTQSTSNSKNRDTNSTATSGSASAICPITCGFCAQVAIKDGIATLTIDPIGTSLKPVNETIQIPSDVLQESQIDCPTMTNNERPIFAGIDKDGQAKCNPLVKPTTCPFPDMQYAIGINAKTGSIICTNIPTRGLACGPDGFMSGFSWTSENISNSCTKRISPYAFNYLDNTSTPVQPTPPVNPTPTPTPDCAYIGGPNGTQFDISNSTNGGFVGRCGDNLCAGYYYVDHCSTPTATPCATNCTYDHGNQTCTSTCATPDNGTAHNSNPSGIGGSHDGAGGNSGAGGGL